MKREEILNEMKAALARYKNIKYEEFNFGTFVKKWDDSNKCGTVCCLWGWEPKFGVLPVEWLDDSSMSVEPKKILNWGKILDYLYYPSTDDLFTGYDEDEKPYIITGFFLYSYSSLFIVLATWAKVIELIETTNKLDQFLNLD